MLQLLHQFHMSKLIEMIVFMIRKTKISDYSSLWKKCCASFGTQCLENDDHLMAIQYFLACNEVININLSSLTLNFNLNLISQIDKIIKHLCEGKFFREAWVIAKMRKEDADPIFTEIMKKWLGYFNECGNYESAAAL